MQQMQLTNAIRQQTSYLPRPHYIMELQCLNDFVAAVAHIMAVARRLARPHPTSPSGCGWAWLGVAVCGWVWRCVGGMAGFFFGTGRTSREPTLSQQILH